MSESRIYIGVIGVGGVGTAFLTQLASLEKTYPQLWPVLIARSTKLYKSADDYSTKLPLSTWEQNLSSAPMHSADPSDILTAALSYLSAAPKDPLTGRCTAAVVDNTSSQLVADSYPAFLAAGISVVTPNKKAFSGTWQLWKEIFAAARSPANPAGGLVYHESSVGAGLPIISTLNELVATGDRVRRIEGVFSGTMSFLFNSFAPVNDGSGGGGGEKKWSEEVKKAKELGYTEPDPRDDLNGLDVARKLVILARLAGLEVGGTDAFPVQSLVPKALEGAGSADEFLRRLPESDGEMETVKKEAEAQGKVIRFLGSVDVGSKQVKVGLEMVDKAGAIAGLKGSDNIISFYTERYGANPLIVQGAGAGGDVTAMGVTADLIKVIQRLS